MNSKVKAPVETRFGYYGDGSLKFRWNDDIMSEILPRLPAKSIARFNLVCKGWLSLFSSVKFRRRHTLCHPKLQPSLILMMPNSQYFYLNPIMNGEELMIRPYTLSLPNHMIVCSCNGLMLLKSEDREPSFYMHNPATKQSREISIANPYTHSVNGRPYIVMVALAFDPSKSLGYKIVCIRCTTKEGTHPNLSHTYLIEVYDSESHSWKLALGPFTFSRMIFFSDWGVYWNGSIYWEVGHDIVYYDIAKNEFKSLPLPNYPSMQSQSRAKNMFAGPSYLQEANGNLYHSKLVTKDNYQSFVFFELQVYEDRCWWLLKEQKIISRYQPTSALGFAQQLKFIKGSYGTETERCCLLYRMSGKIIAYDFLDKSSKVLVDLSVQPFHQAKDADEDFNLQCYEFGECLAVV